MKICRDKTGFSAANNNSNYDAFIKHHAFQVPHTEMHFTLALVAPT